MAGAKGAFNALRKRGAQLALHELHESKLIEWKLHGDSTKGPHCYDVIIWHDAMAELGAQLGFGSQAMTWDESAVAAKGTH